MRFLSSEGTLTLLLSVLSISNVFSISIKPGVCYGGWRNMEDTDDEHAVKMVRTIELPVELWQKIKLYQHGNQCGSRVAAIRQMLSR